MSEPAACLDDETLVSFVRGVIDPVDLARVDDHLDRCESCFEIAAALSGRVEHRLPSPGDRVGRYSVLEVLGQGAMGVVVAAYDGELDRRLALKLLPSENDDAKRWLEEARALARVTHPNVVGVFEVGQAEGFVYIAMELVVGSTLRTWLEVPRGWKEIRKVFVEAAHGLAAAHERGVVHRDFKLDNVMISRQGQAKVTDFGLARVSVDGALEPSPGDTSAPMLRTRAAGTPAYMAPELFDRKTASAKSDQFAFAVSLWEALFGKRPFAGEDLETLAANVRRAEVVDPKGRVPAFVVGALRRALAKDSEARFPSMSAFALELTRDERTNHRPWIAAGVAALVCGGFVLTTLERFGGPSCDAGAERFSSQWDAAARDRLLTARPAHAESAARLVGAIDRWGERWSSMHDATCERAARKQQSDAMLDLQVACLDRALLAVEPFATRAASDPTGKGLEAAFDKIDEVLPDLSACSQLDPTGARQLPNDPVQREQVERLVVRAAELRASLAIDGANRASKEIDAIVTDAKATSHDPIVGEVALLAANVARERGDFEGARRFLGDALLAFGNAKDRRSEAATWLRFLSLQGSQGLYTEAEHSSKLVYSLLVGLGTPSELELEYRETMGAVHTSMGRLEDAEADLQLALEIEKRSASGPSRARSRILTNLGNLARAQGDLPRALELHRLAKTLDEERLGPSNADVPRHLHNIAGVLKMMGQRDEALAAYRESLSKREAIVGRDSPDCAVTHNSLGIFLAEDGDLALGRKHLLEAKRIFERTAHAHEVVARENLEWLARLEDDVDSADDVDPERPARTPSRPNVAVAPSKPVASARPPAVTSVTPPKPAQTVVQPSKINTPNGSGAYVPSPAWP